MFGLNVGFVVLMVLVLIVVNAVKIVPEYQRGVVFRLGRIIGAKGPGLFFIIPIVDRMVRVDLRTLTHDVPSQDVITRDNVPCTVNAVVYYRVVDPNRSVIQIENHHVATSQIAQTTLRSVLGQVEFDELLSQREQINSKLQKIIDQQTDPWGVKVSLVEVKHVQIPEQMLRAISHQAEAERDRRARIINAEGEFQASQKLADAAEIIARSPIALQLRFLQTAAQIAADKNSTTIFPLPIELLKPFMKMADGDAGPRAAPAGGELRR